MKKFVSLKKRFSLIMALCMLTAFAPQAMAANPSEYSLNGTVEPYWGSDAATVDRLTEEIDGVNTVVHKVTVKNVWGGANIKSSSALQLGKRYQVDFWARVDTDFTGDSVQLRVHNPDHPDNTKHLLFDVTKQWQHFTGSFEATAPQGANEFWGVFIGGNGDENLKDKAFYFHSFKLYDGTGAEIGTDLAQSIPANGATTAATDIVTLQFGGAMSDAAAKAASYTVTGGTNPLHVESVEEKENNTYILHLSGKTENKAQYTVSFAGLKNWFGADIAQQSITFFSSEKVLFDHSFNTGDPILKDNSDGYLYNYNYSTDAIERSIDADADSSATSSALKVAVKADGGLASRIGLQDGSWNTITFSQGQKYQLSFRCKKGSANTGDIILLPMEGEKLEWSVQQCALDNTEWKTFSAEYTATGSGAFFIFINGAKPGDIIYLDDIRLSAIEEVAPFTLTDSTPSDGGACDTFDGVTLTFSNPLGSKGTEASSYTLSGGTQTVQEVKMLGQNKYKLVFDNFLTENKEYRLKLDVTDEYGRPLKTEITFTTPAKVLVKSGFGEGSQEKGGNVWATLPAQSQDIMPFEWMSAVDANGMPDSGSMKYTSKGAERWGSNLIWVKDGKQIDIPVTAGKRYTVLMKLKTSATVSLLPIVAGDAYWDAEIKDTGENAWRSYSVTFTPTKDNGSLYFSCEAAQDTVFYIDDFAFFTEPDALTVSGSTESMNGNTVTLAFSNEMKAETVQNTANYTIENAEIDKIEKISGNSFRMSFKELLPNVTYNLRYSGLEDIYTQKAAGSYEFSITPESKLYFDATKLYLDYGTEGKHEITDGYIAEGTITAEVGGIMNFSGKAQNLRLIVGYYENGTLAKAAVQDMTVAADTTDVKTLTASVEVPEKIEGVTRKLRAFLWDSISLAPVCKPVDLHDFELTTIHVAPQLADGVDYTSPMAANAAISDSSAENRYVIDIAPGEYDTYDETETYYKNTSGGWVIKPYVTLRGQDRERCIIRGALPDAYAGTAEGRAKITSYSTVNLVESCTLENLTITAENMRYPIHDEGGGLNRDAVHRIKNCHIEHIGTDGAIKYYKDNNIGDNEYDVWHWTSAYGYGSASGEVCIFENTTFKSNSRAWYVHSQAEFQRPQINILNNCHMDAGNMADVMVEALGSGTDDRVVLNHCTFDGLYISYSDSPWIYSDMNGQYADHAEYKITLNHCDPIGFKNYQRGLALAVYSNNTDSGSAVEISGSAAPVLFGDTTVRHGGGGANGYIYGSYDISGILTTLSANKEVNNTIGRRLGDCTSNAKLLMLTFDGNASKSVTVRFGRDYTQLTNAEILQEINSQISEYGTAAEYNVSREEYYPAFPDKEFTFTNNSSAAIPRFAAICVRNGKYERMTSEDSADNFAGIALERVVPGESGRVLTEGYLCDEQLGTDPVANGTHIAVKADGTYEINGSGSRIMTCDNDYGWAYFTAATALRP